MSGKAFGVPVACEAIYLVKRQSTTLRQKASIVIGIHAKIDSTCGFWIVGRLHEELGNPGEVFRTFTRHRDVNSTAFKGANVGFDPQARPPLIGVMRSLSSSNLRRPAAGISRLGFPLCRR